MFVEPQFGNLICRRPILKIIPIVPLHDKVTQKSVSFWRHPSTGLCIHHCFKRVVRRILPTATNSARECWSPCLVARELVSGCVDLCGLEVLQERVFGLWYNTVRYSTVPCLPSSHPHVVYTMLSNCNPALLFIIFSSRGIFLHISPPTVDSRIDTYIMYYYFNVIHV